MSFEIFKAWFEQPTAWSAGLTTPMKGGNGPRLVAVEVPVIHVDGASDPPPLKAAKARKIAATKPRARAKAKTESVEPPPEDIVMSTLNDMASEDPQPATEPTQDDWWWKPLQGDEKQPRAPKLDDVPDFITADLKAKAKANRARKAKPEPETKADPPPKDDDEEQEDPGYSGKRRARGTKVAEFPYLTADGRAYILVRKYKNAAGEKYFIPFRPEGGHWRKGIKGTPRARKIPYRLPELIAALA
jgi:hypothetical protein